MPMGARSRFVIGGASPERARAWGESNRASPERARTAGESHGTSPDRARAWGESNGFTFIELLVVTTILLILASAVMPLAKVTVQRQREMELHRVLREMRTAIDKYKDAVDNGLIGSVDVKAGSEGYPPDLDTLVEGVSVANDASGRKLKFLRRVPIDPITNSTEWGLRAYGDKPDSTSWGGGNVYDVYSKSEGTALDGTKYRDW
jgi:general secretion pathway protein G